MYDPLHFHRGQAHLYVKDARATNEQVTVQISGDPSKKKSEHQNCQGSLWVTD